MKQTIGFICDNANNEITDKLLSWCKKNIKNFSFVNVNKNKKAKSILDNADHAIDLLSKNKINRLIAIDDFGIAVFMYISKFPGIVVAEISDEHSAKMTIGHNNATALSFGSKISTFELMTKMISAYCKNKYEGARHKVRIDMMDELAKGGR